MASDLVRTVDLRKTYRPRRWFGAIRTVVALDGVSLSIPRGTTLALTGPSGSGKSTLGRCIAQLEDATSGEVWFDGQRVSGSGGRDLHSYRKQIQFIFQDAGTGLNPRFSAAEIVEEPLVIAGWNARDRRRRALEVMDHVQLSPAWVDRRPCEFSGGQRQRLAIARALALNPKLLIFDESLSGVDVSIQAQLVNLLLALQASLCLTYLFISHDLALIPYVANEVAILNQGKIVKVCSMVDLYRYQTQRVVHPSSERITQSSAGVSAV